MKQVLGLLLSGMLLSGVALAQDATAKKSEAKPSETKTATLHGYIVDAMCAQGMAKKAKPAEKAAGHTKSCALEDNCAASGYGVFSGSDWVKFDAAGDKLAKELIEKSSKEKGIMVDVTGTHDGDKFAVASIKESSMGSMKSKEKASSSSSDMEHQH